MTRTEIFLGIAAQTVGLLAALAAALRYLVGRVVVDHDRERTFDRVAAWFPEERPDASESLPKRVDKTLDVAREALALAGDTRTRLDAHLTAEEQDRAQGLKDRRKFESGILDRLTQIEEKVR